MGDLMAIQEKLGTGWKQKKIVMSWAYSDRVKSPGVPQAMLIACSLLGADLTLAHPKGYELDEEYMAFAKKALQRAAAKLETLPTIFMRPAQMQMSSMPRAGAARTA